MNDSQDLGPLPEPVIEDKEPNPGGADAVPESPVEGLARDLDPADNPAVDDVLPEQIAELDDDKQQEPDEDSDDDTVEPPA